ncbi:hypothetical protein OPQ81_006313 [Rhizoctonia solani]|nr:hypothetical protein OPQ81_006313 [Rhizoctonia solani]
MCTALAAALASAVLLCVSAAPSLSLSLVTPKSVSNVEDFIVTAVLKNTGTETLKLLKDHRSVLSPTRTHTFNVVSEKGSPEFMGMFIKYSPEAAVKKNNAAGFTTLAPGQSFEITHSLAGVYNFTNTGAGDFKLDALSNVFEYIDSSGNLAMIEASTESKKIGLSGKLVSTVTSQQARIAEAVTVANEYVSGATSYLNRINSRTTRYTTWFGNYDANRFSTVRSHFSLIGTDASSTTYDCSTCTEDAMAYVYASEPGRIYLCGSFWDAELTGTDSQAGTIIHEQSHFTVNGGTEDHVYGQSRAMSLAKSSPALAIMNADSHEYFAENTPELS